MPTPLLGHTTPPYRPCSRTGRSNIVARSRMLQPLLKSVVPQSLEAFSFLRVSHCVSMSVRGIGDARHSSYPWMAPWTQSCLMLGRFTFPVKVRSNVPLQALASTLSRPIDPLRRAPARHRGRQQAPKHPSLRNSSRLPREKALCLTWSCSTGKLPLRYAGCGLRFMTFVWTPQLQPNRFDVGPYG